MQFEQRKSASSDPDENVPIADSTVNESFFMEAFEYRANSKEKS